MLGHELGVLTQAVAGALDLDDDGVVNEAVEERGGDHRVAKDLASLGEAADADHALMEDPPLEPENRAERHHGQGLKPRISSLFF